MKARCYNPKAINFYNYGGRGITVCDRWRNSFEAFLEDMKPRPTIKHTIEREKTDGNYEPDNCFWATRAQQSRNTRRNVFVTIGEQKLALVDACKQLGLRYTTVKGRMNRRGMTFKEASTVPVVNGKPFRCRAEVDMSTWKK